MITRFKLTDALMQTKNGFQWELGVECSMQPPLIMCKHGLHCYSSPLLGLFMNPIHANIDNPRIFSCLVDGEHLEDNGVKECWEHMTLISELTLAAPSIVQRVAFEILCTLKVCSEPTFVLWANRWLSGEDRSKEFADTAAYAAAHAAADAAAAKPLDFENLIKKAMEVV